MMSPANFKSHFLLIVGERYWRECIMWNNFSLISSESFGYRHSYVNTVQSTCKSVCVCVCLHCVQLWECMQKPFEVPHSPFTPVPHVSSLFEDHVAVMFKDTLIRLQTYGINMDMRWHQAHFAAPCDLKQSLWERHYIHTAYDSVHHLWCLVSEADCFQICKFASIVPFSPCILQWFWIQTKILIETVIPCKNRAGLIKRSCSSLLDWMFDLHWAWLQFLTLNLSTLNPAHEQLRWSHANIALKK